MFQQRAAHAYAQIGLETGVAASSPHRLILMLYDGAMKCITDAALHRAAGRTADKGAALSRAIAIIEEGLMGSLDVSRGGTIAAHRNELYDYMTRRLPTAIIRNDTGAMAEVRGLLGELRDAWASIDAPHANQAARTPVLA
ncbi:MAG: flagellar export chaperone FliS [Casimicrobiaceae bacterium]